MFKCTTRRVVGGLCLLSLVLFSLVAAFSRNPSAADEPFLAEVPLPDGVHKLRLLRVQDEHLTYRWKAPLGTKLLSRMRYDRDSLHDIDLSGRLLAPFAGWKPTSFLFRVANDHNEWANPWKYFIVNYEFVESTGYTFLKHPCTQEYPDAGAHLVMTSSFPRRDKQLTIRMKLLAAKMGEKDTTQQFTIPNPFYREEFPAWTPEPVPSTKTVEGVTVRLADLGYGGKYFRPNFVQQVAEDRWESCDSSMHVEDATGNQGETLSPFEPAWKIMADIFPVPSSHFPVEQVVAVGQFRIPAIGEVIPIEKQFIVGGATVKVRCVCGGGSAEQTTEGRWKGSPVSIPYGATENENQVSLLSLGKVSPFVVIEMKNLQRDRGLLARCHTKVGIQGSISMYLFENKLVAVPIRGAQDASTEFTFELVESRPKRFEFIIEPLQRWRDEVTHPEPEVPVEIQQLGPIRKALDSVP